MSPAVLFPVQGHLLGGNPANGGMPALLFGQQPFITGARAGRVFTTAANGNVSDSATWVGGIAPYTGADTQDTWVVNHALNVESDCYVGTKTGFAIVMGESSASTITVAVGRKLVVKGSIQKGDTQTGTWGIAKITVLSGASLLFLIDTGIAQILSTQNYQRGTLKVAGVAGVRGTIGMHPSAGVGTSWQLADGGNLHVGHIDFSYANIQRCGDASNIGIYVSHYERGGVGPKQVLANVEFNTCGSFFQDWAGWGANSVISWTNVTWKNTLGSVTLDGYGTTVATQQSYTGCVFDQTPNAIWAFGSSWTDCQFKEGFGIQGSSPPLAFLRCVFWEALGDQLYQILGYGTTVTDSIFINTWSSSSDSHGTGISYDPAIAGTTITLDGCTFEMYTAIGGQGNCVLTPGAAITDVFDVIFKRCIVLPNPADGYSYGDFVHHYTSGATGGPRVSLLHNTIQAAGDGTTALDVVYSGGVRVLVNKSNIYWDSVAGRAHVQYNSNFLTGLNGDTMLSGGAATDYNNCFNLIADRYSTATIFTYTTAPGANDITTDPNFVDRTRNMATFYRSLLSTTGSNRTDAEAALLMMRARNDDTGYNASFTPLAYLTYLRAGFTPQNTALFTSAHDGTTRGAVQVAAGATVTSGPAVSTWTVPTATVSVGPVSVASGPAIGNWVVPTATITIGPVSVASGPAIANWVVPTATVSVGAISVAAGPSIATWVVPTATIVLGGVTVTAGPAIATWNVPSDVITLGNINVAAGPAVANWVVPTATVSVGAVNVASGPAIATWVVPTAVVSVGAVNVASGPAVANWVVPTATATGANTPQTVTGGPAIANWVVPTATVILGNVNVASGPAIRNWVVPTATVSVGSVNVASGPAIATWAVPTATPSVGPVNVASGPAIATWVVPTATATPGNTPQTVTGGPAVANWVVPTATVVLGGVSVVASPAIAAWVIPTASVSQGGSAVVSGPAFVTWVVPTAIVTTDPNARVVTGGPAIRTSVVVPATVTVGTPTFPVATDIIQRTVETIVGILDTAQVVVAITGRGSINCVPYEDTTFDVLPIYDYYVVTADYFGGVGDTREIIVDLRATAETNTLCNEMLRVAESLLIAPNYAVLGLNACTLRAKRRDVDVDPDAEQGVKTKMLELTLLVTN